MRIIDSNNTKKLISGLLAVNMAAGLSSCAYLDEYLETLEGVESSSSQTEVTDTTESVFKTDSETTEDSSSFVSDESAADSSQTDSTASENSQDSSSRVQTTAPDSSKTESKSESKSKSKSDDSSHITDYNTDSFADSSESDSSDTDTQSETDIVTPALNTIYDKYAEVIYNYSQKCAEDPAYLADYCGYLIFDIDLSGTPELLIQMGTCEADREVVLYTYNEEEGEAELTGSFSMWHSSMGFMNDMLYTETSTLGTYTLYTITIEDDEVVREKVDTYEESQLTNTLTFYGFDNSEAIDSLEKTSLI